MADDDADAYALRTPAAGRRDTIARQLQREILGEAKTEDDEPARRTLSPAEAAALQEAQALDAAVSRRDTVSPTQLKAVLKATELGADSAEKKQQQQPPPKPADDTKATDERRKSASSDSFTDSMFAPNLLEQDAVRRTTLDPTEAASVVAALQMEVRSLNGSVLEDTESDDDNQAAAQPKASKIKPPTPLEQLKGKKTPPSKESETSPATSKESDRKKTPSPAKESKGRKTPSPAKEAKGRKTPTPAKEATSKKTPSPSKETKSRKTPSPAEEAKRGKASPPKETKSSKTPSPSKENNSQRSPAQTKESKSKKSPTPTKSSSKRRATVDPSDVLTMLEDSSQQEDDRRQTIDENGLLELTSALESPSTSGKDSARKRKEEESRKRTNDSNTRGGSPEKRARSDVDNNQDQTMESMEIDSPLQPDAKASSPSPSTKDRRNASRNNQSSPNDLSQNPKPLMFSPPPGGTQIRTPLKGILSARKGKRTAGGAVQTTPNKSVNFGPSQGAEFNHGSPSTSMTPMPAKDASRLFPSEQPASSEEEVDDAETSLNSSILDEADSLDEEDPKKIVIPKTFQSTKSGFDLLQSRRSSLLAPKSTDKSRRRHSLRGYSPLDSQAEARRRRRRTINVTRQTSSASTAATSFTTAKKPVASSQSPPSARNNSFLRATDVLETSRMPYADSSASSDAGEDMEITGDYSIILGRDGEGLGKQATSSAGLPRDDDTAEFSLGHLLAESSVYELTKSAPEPDLHDLPGSLGDLANEVADAPSSQGSLGVDASQKSNEQDTTLDPIQEVDETMASSRGQSMMSLVSSDDSDEEYAARRKSLQVKLESKFDRVSTGAAEPSDKARDPPTPESLSVHLITMEELLSSVALDEENASVETSELFFGEETESPDDQALNDVKLACAFDTCSDVIDRHAQDVSSWSSAVAEELSSLLHIKAPAVFSPENLDDAGREAIRELYATEAMVARSGWCQLQAQMEQQLVNSLSLGADALANDVKTLKNSISTDTLKRQNELAAIKEMIEREEQMALLLDAIEEQQGAHDEYVTAVQDLEKECSSLSLEESVLQSRLKVLEGRAAELEPVTSAAATLFEQEVLATEEMLAIQESMSVWKIREATATLLRVSARFEDVLFDVEIEVSVHLGSSSTGGASTSIKVNEYLKHREQNTYLPIEGDVVLVLQRLLLDPHYISGIADESEVGDGNDGRVCSKLQVLENFISRSFRLLKELRELSTHFAMRFDEEGSTLWVDFLKFPSAAASMSVNGAQFSVGFSLLPTFPYTDYQTAVMIPHGQVCFS
ncbi:unnamed protein product [Phytophthora lilii]|uniref:Unnamed protein product n=1 Tax=Phytophthora lilii TaxID=2077276 RepID=A0A9W7DC21_9STRA|nr:unnamed protein product [Phytophthora lilii]